MPRRADVLSALPDLSVLVALAPGKGPFGFKLGKGPELKPKIGQLGLPNRLQNRARGVLGAIWGVPEALGGGSGGVSEHLETMLVLKEGCTGMAGRFGDPFWAVLGPKMGPQIGPRRLPIGFKI